MKTSIAYIGIAFIVIIALYLIMNAPQILLPTTDIELNPKDLTLLQIDARRYMAQLVGGAVVIFGLYLIFRRIVALEKNVYVTQEGQITERFTKAIDQLGTYKLEVQLGGIFALEKIARDSVKDHWTIMEVLTAYVRENAQWVDEAPNSDKMLLENEHTNGNSKLKRVPTDIQAILSVIGRRKWVEREQEELRVINLRKTKLENVDLRRAFLERANFRGSNLARANLVEADLAYAFLGEVNLTDANLLKANLQGANLSGANLEGANLKGANLQGANLSKARLRGAILVEAELERAILSEADLEEGNLCSVSLMNVNLTNTKLKKIKYDYDTIFPDWLDQNMKEELGMAFDQS